MTDLSFAEELLWLADRADPRAYPFVDCAPSLSTVVRLQGQLDEAALDASLDEVIRRHEVLRSRFVEHEGRPVRICEPARPIALTRFDLREMPYADRWEVATRMVSNDLRRPFDLARGPLIRGILAVLAGEDHLLAVTVHHVVFDRWSTRVLAHDLKQLYDAHVAGRAPQLEPLAMQYPDYVRWQRQRLEGELGRALTEHWAAKLRDLTDLALPCDGRRERASTRADTCWFTIPSNDVARLAAMGRQCRVTLATLMLAVYMLALYRVSGVDDITVGVPVSDRRRPEFEGMIGLFTNAVAVRAAVAPHMTFLELLDRARGALVEACRYQDMPFGYLLRAIGLERPPYRVLFNFMPVIPESTLELAGLHVERVGVATEPESLADMSLNVRPESGSLVCRLLYKADLFSSTRMRAFAAQIQALVTETVDEGRATVAHASAGVADCA